MKEDVEDDILIKNYLLGNLRQEEQLQVEERLFFDRKYFQMLQVVEDDLIDDYVYEDLSSDEHERFENYFLSTPERHEALRIAQALKSYTSTNLGSESPPVADHVRHVLSSRISFPSFLRFQNLLWKLPLAVATLLLIVGGLWLLIKAVRTPDRTHPVQEAQQPPRPSDNQTSSQQTDEQRARDANLQRDAQNKQEQYAGQQNREPSGTVPGKGNGSISPTRSANQVRSPGSQAGKRATQVYAFLLIPGGPMRGEEDLNEVNLPAGAKVVKLQLPLVEDVDYINFRVVLYSEDNKAIRMWNGLNSTNSKAGKVVPVKIPVELLQQQKYRIILNGIAPAGDVKEIHTYYFRVSQR